MERRYEVKFKDANYKIKVGVNGTVYTLIGEEMWRVLHNKRDTSSEYVAIVVKTEQSEITSVLRSNKAKKALTKFAKGGDYIKYISKHNEPHLSYSDIETFGLVDTDTVNSISVGGVVLTSMVGGCIKGDTLPDTAKRFDEIKGDIVDSVTSYLTEDEFKESLIAEQLTIFRPLPFIPEVTSIVTPVVFNHTDKVSFTQNASGLEAVGLTSNEVQYCLDNNVQVFNMGHSLDFKSYTHARAIILSTIFNTININDGDKVVKFITIVKDGTTTYTKNIVKGS